SLMVKEQLGAQKPHKASPGLVLKWYEGLLVLDAIENGPEEVRSSCKWFQDVRHILETERQRRSLSASLWLKQQLLDSAVTGPKFVTRDGTVVCHRRNSLYKDLPTDCADLPPGWYKVQSVLDYLPPWEAFAHKACGLYQEFYLVQWAESGKDYSSTNQGSEVNIGCTWEPDECLPDDLDSLRSQAKRLWLDRQAQREREVKLKDFHLPAMGMLGHASRQRITPKVNHATSNSRLQPVPSGGRGGEAP
ncbi:unnamed protein product, partial [Polarella glacialis]